MTAKDVPLDGVGAHLGAGDGSFSRKLLARSMTVYLVDDWTALELASMARVFFHESAARVSVNSPPAFLAWMDSLKGYAGLDWVWLSGRSTEIPDEELRKILKKDGLIFRDEAQEPLPEAEHPLLGHSGAEGEGDPHAPLLPEGPPP